MKITETVLRRPVAATVLMIAISVTGLFSLSRLSVDYLPKVTYPMIKVHIWWRGATPEEVETNIAEPIERVMATIDNLDYLQSSSIEGMYTLLVNFGYGVDVDVAYQDVMTAMGRASRKLPPGIDPPVIKKADPTQLPVMQVTLSSEKRDLVRLREWADNWFTDRMTAVPGTAGVEIVGGLKREIRVHLDPERLQAYNLTPAGISKVLFGENVEMFAGRVTVKDKEIIARTMGEFETLGELESVTVGRGKNGEMVLLKDVASVEDSHEEMRVNTRFNSKPCVKVNVLKQAEANTVKVADAVKERLRQLKGDIPRDIQLGFVENQGDYVMGAINSVRDAALLAAILVILVVYLFLGRWRQVFVMVVALPITILANFVVMKIAGFSVNVFSLGGIVVALSIILDNSIVVLENITRLKDEGIKDYVKKGTAEVGSAIVASTLTFLAIFLPFLFVPGLAALLFKELVLVIAGIVVISLVVSVTVTPVLSRLLLQKDLGTQASGPARLFSSLIGTITSGYAGFLASCIRAKWLVVTITVGIFAGGLFLSQYVGSEFLPKPDDGRVKVQVKMPSGTAVGYVDGLLEKIESRLKGIPEIESIFTLAGGKVWGLYTYEIAHQGELDIQLVPRGERKITTKGFIKKIRPMVSKIPAPGGKIAVMQMKVKGIRKIGTQDVEVKVKGTEIVPVYEFAKAVAANLKTLEGLTNTNITMDMTKPEYRVYVDRARASAMGVRVRDVASTLRSLINGLVTTQYREGSEYYNIRVMIPERKISGKTSLENLVLENNAGLPVYLKDIAEVRRGTGPVEIVREDQAKEVIVAADAAGISVGDAVVLAEKAVGKLKRIPGVEWEMGGQAQMMAENRRSMGMVIAFAALFAYVILAIQFESFIIPLLIMLSVPFSITGTFLALSITNTPIGLTVLIGFVVMMGCIAAQGVVLLSLAEQYRKSGLAPTEAILKAAPIRVRPILMTQTAMILALVPLSMNWGEGGDMLQPMAIAVIGGLLYSFVVTLLFLPSAYALVTQGHHNEAKPETLAGP